MDENSLDGSTFAVTQAQIEGSLGKYTSLETGASTATPKSSVLIVPRRFFWITAGVLWGLSSPITGISPCTSIEDFG